MDLFSFVLVGAAFSFTILVALAKTKAATTRSHWEAWEAFGEAHGLTHSDEVIFGLPVLKGTVEGFAVDIHRNLRSHGKSKSSYTVITVSLNLPLPSNMKVTKPLLGGALLTRLGTQDIPLADPRLDQSLRIQGRHPEAIQDLLDIWTVQEALRSFFHQGQLTCIKKNEVVMDRLGTLTGPSLEAAFAATLGMARALDEGPALAWQDLATRHALTLTRTGTAVRLEGEHLGSPVVVESPEIAWTRLCFALPDLHPSVRITSGTGGFAAKDPIVGGRVCIAGEDAALKAQFEGRRLDGLRGDLLQVFETWPEALIADSTLSITVGGQPYRTIDRLLEALGALAAALRREGGSPTS